MADRLPAEVQLDPYQAELDQLREQNAKLQQIVVQRSVNTVGEFIDGLRGILNAAAQGDPQAYSNLIELTQLLEQARGIAKGVVPVGRILRPGNGKA